MIDCPEYATISEPAITKRTLHRPEPAELERTLNAGLRKLSVNNVACPIVEPAATARDKLNIPTMSTI